MEDLKVTFAGNLIKLRTNAGLTQLELADKLNYTDKAISKWERAESLPDVVTLKSLAELFGVTIDYLLQTHEQWERPKNDSKFSTKTLITVVMIGIWTFAFLLFIIFWLLGSTIWLFFVGALPVSLITLLVLNSIWHQRKNNVWVVEALVLSLFVLIYFIFLKYNIWKIFLLEIPAFLIVYFSYHIKKGFKKAKNKGK